MRVYKLDRELRCTCGHSHEEHHGGCVMNPEYLDYPLNIDGIVGQECEHNQNEGHYWLNKGDKKVCKCNGFKPRSTYVKNLVKEWREKHPGR